MTPAAPERESERAQKARILGASASASEGGETADGSQNRASSGIVSSVNLAMQ
jgi:hypothetical protein